MRKVRIVIAVESPFPEAFQLLVEPHTEELEVVVSTAADEFALGEELRSLLSREPMDPDDPLAVIASFPSERNSFSACSWLLLEFPDIILYVLESNATTRYRACIEACQMPSSLDSLIADLCRISSTGLAPLQVVRPESEEPDR